MKLFCALLSLFVLSAVALPLADEENASSTSGSGREESSNTTSGKEESSNTTSGKEESSNISSGSESCEKDGKQQFGDTDKGLYGYVWPQDNSGAFVTGGEQIWSEKERREYRGKEEKFREEQIKREEKEREEQRKREDKEREEQRKREDKEREEWRKIEEKEREEQREREKENERVRMLTSLAVANDAGSIMKNLAFLNLLKNSPKSVGYGKQDFDINNRNPSCSSSMLQPVINPYQNFVINLPSL
ncbi:cilia- and flagella-associated protein 251-like [Diorhabda sublineata]|uniref:cilia- and flagella-associated protein 251-like n=1 Tax=Diorhabda sublineata TaxID=1163346 RepID=UPI0024E08E19|nr:cilia- and flagella-associated protein 251-like [Diorhabda sublineata]